MIGLWLVALLVVGGVIYLGTIPPPETRLTAQDPTVTAATIPNQPNLPTATPRPASLEAALQEVIKRNRPGLGAKADFGIVVHNLDKGDKFSLNEHKNYQTASVYKLFVMLATYYDISQGNVTLDTPVTLTSDAADAEEDGSLLIPIGQSLPISDLLDPMITNSNNTAALMLLFRVRIPRLRELIADLGFKESDLSDSFNYQATPADLDAFLSRLADHKLLGQPYDDQMLDLMLRQKIRDRIPAQLPPGTKVADKIGNLNDVTNDTGLVFLPNGQRLAITVMVSNFDDGPASYKFISDISLAAYNYYAN